MLSHIMRAFEMNEPFSRFAKKKIFFLMDLVWCILWAFHLSGFYLPVAAAFLGAFYYSLFHVYCFIRIIIACAYPFIFWMLYSFPRLSCKVLFFSFNPQKRKKLMFSCTLSLWLLTKWMHVYVTWGNFSFISSRYQMWMKPIHDAIKAIRDCLQFSISQTSKN